jgi:hypothetical protein
MNRNIFHHADEKVPRFPGTTSFAWISPGPEDLRRAAQKRNSRLATAPRARRLSE